MQRRKNIRPTVLARDGKVCRVCNKPCPDDAEVDHAIPVGLGGADEAAQCQVLCKACHKRKTKQDVRAIAKAKRVGKRQDELRARLEEKAGRA